MIFSSSASCTKYNIDKNLVLTYVENGAHKIELKYKDSILMLSFLFHHDVYFLTKKTASTTEYEKLSNLLVQENYKKFCEGWSLLCV